MMIKIHLKHRPSWYRLFLGAWAVAWVLVAVLMIRAESRQISIPQNMDLKVSLPTVNEQALAEIRARESAGLIVPTQNSSPRTDPFQ